MALYLLCHRSNERSRRNLYKGSYERFSHRYRAASGAIARGKRPPVTDSRDNVQVSFSMVQIFTCMEVYYENNSLLCFAYECAYKSDTLIHWRFSMDMSTASNTC
ncbi:hypothetical protein J2S74_000579 [Evansella vedderi]|uniref:Uncharacterized protein n=1 Tax=Evansella vedderi TaxID=38282 RepID=A0ABT9ZPP0_9BACI|nr:hypothetical protein [Evansella vedderi]